MKAKYILAIIATTALTFSFVWVRLQIVSISYEINELSKKEKAIREDCSSLTLRINQAKSPQRLEHLAGARFNMHPPKASQLIILGDR